MSLALRSPAFDDQETMPIVHTGEGHDSSPELLWEGVPEGAKELALVMEDPDAPTPEPWVHWVVYRLDPRLGRLPEGVPSGAHLEQPVPLCQGTNSWGRDDYGGPMPPKGHGWHRYHFHLYALDAPLDLPPGASLAQLRRAMEGHVLEAATLTARYRR